MRTVHWFPQMTHQFPGHTFHSKVKQNQTDFSIETCHLSLPMSYNPRPSSSHWHQCPMTNFHLSLGHSTGPCLPSSYISWTPDFFVRKCFCLCTFRIGRPQGDTPSGEEGPHNEHRTALRVAFTLAYMQGAGISLSKPLAVTAWTEELSTSDLTFWLHLRAQKTWATVTLWSSLCREWCELLRDVISPKFTSALIAVRGQGGRRWAPRTEAVWTAAHKEPLYGAFCALFPLSPETRKANKGRNTSHLLPPPQWCYRCRGRQRTGAGCAHSAPARVGAAFSFKSPHCVTEGRRRDSGWAGAAPSLPLPAANASPRTSPSALPSAPLSVPSAGAAHARRGAERGSAARRGAAMAGGEQRGERPGGPARVALQKEIGLGSACAIIIGKGGTARPRLAPRHRWLPPSGAGGKGRLGWGSLGTRLPGGSQVSCPLKAARGGCAAGSGTAAAPGSRASPCPRVWGKTLFPFWGLIIQARRVPWQRRIAWKPWENAAFGLNLFLLCVELVLFLFR